jgi:hypothetical protein
MFPVPTIPSLAWAITDGKRIMNFLRDAVREVMARDVEPLTVRGIGEGVCTQEFTRMLLIGLVGEPTIPININRVYSTEVPSRAENTTRDSSDCRSSLRLTSSQPESFQPRYDRLGRNLAMSI